MRRKIAGVLILCVLIAAAGVVVFPALSPNQPQPVENTAISPDLPGGPVGTPGTICIRTPGPTSDPVSSHDPVPPEYFADAKPAVPLSSEELMTMVFSQGTYQSMISPEDDELVLLPSSVPKDFTQVSQGVFVESGIGRDDAVVMFQMPAEMYERYLSAGGEDQYIPGKFFFKEFDTLTSFSEKTGVVIE